MATKNEDMMKNQYDFDVLENELLGNIGAESQVGQENVKEDRIYQGMLKEPGSMSDISIYGRSEDEVLKKIQRYNNARAESNKLFLYDMTKLNEVGQYVHYSNYNMQTQQQKPGKTEEKTAASPLREENYASQLLEILKTQNFIEAAKNMDKLFQAIGNMETELKAVSDELKSVRKQLSDVTEERKELKAVENSVKEGQEGIKAVQEKVENLAKETVLGYKQKGQILFDKIAAFLHIKERLILIGEKLNNSINSINEMLERMDKAGQELRRMGGHARNAAKALTGRELEQEMERAEQLKFIKIVEAPFKFVKKLFEELIHNVNKAVDCIDSIENSRQLLPGNLDKGGAVSVKDGNIKDDYHEGQAVDVWIFEDKNILPGNITGSITAVSDNTVKIETTDNQEFTVSAEDIFTAAQGKVFERALADKCTASQFEVLARNELSAAQMEEIRFGFKDGLTLEQVEGYASPDLLPAQMDLCRYGMKNGMDMEEIRPLITNKECKLWIDIRKDMDKTINSRNQEPVSIMVKLKEKQEQARKTASEDLKPQKEADREPDRAAEL